MRARESFFLYGVILVCSFGFFLTGLFLGKRYFIRANLDPREMIVSKPQLEDVKGNLDFYQQVLSAFWETAIEERKDEDLPGEAGAAADEKKAELELRRKIAGVPTEVYTVQVGALNREKDARPILIRLEVKGYSARLHRPQADNPFYCVWVSEFVTLEEARQMESSLKEDGFYTYIKKVPIARLN